jgi:hypothetical protein
MGVETDRRSRFVDLTSRDTFTLGEHDAQRHDELVQQGDRYARLWASWQAGLMVRPRRFGTGLGANG